MNSRADIRTEMDYVGKAKLVIQTEIKELQRLAERIDNEFVFAVGALQDALRNGGKIVVAGVGKSENIATKVVATFNSTGAPSVMLDCQNALHGDIGIVMEGDTAIALSYSGETAQLLDILPHLKRKAVTIIAITGKRNSTLALNSDIVLDVNVESEACPLNLAPTSSTTNMLALGDALAMVLLEARGFNEEDFAQLHPSGSLGRRLLTKVTDIMRKGGDFAVVRPSDTVGTALEVMTKCKAGAVVATDAEDNLEGIFTHGDFVRGYQKDRHIADHLVSEYMSRDPIVISGDKLAAEVVHMLEENRIDEIVVIGEDRKVIGLVDVQDLSRSHIF